MVTSLTVFVALFLGGDLSANAVNYRADDKEESANKGKIEGTKWSSLAGTVKGQKIPAGTLKLEFTKDGKMIYNTPLGTFEGTYTLKPGDKVLWEFTKELGGSKKHEQKMVVNKDGKLTVSDTDGTTLDFEKVNAPDNKKDDESANKGKIEGTKWSSLAGKVKGQDIPAGTLKLEFTKDGKMTYTTPIGTFEGTYKLLKGDKVLWSFTKELGGRKEHEQKMVVNKDGKLTVSDTDGTTLDFEKK